MARLLLSFLAFATGACAATLTATLTLGLAPRPARPTTVGTPRGPGGTPLEALIGGVRPSYTTYAL